MEDRRFTYDVLRAVAALDEDTLQGELRRLVEAELLYQSGFPPQARYIFKHALIRDAAYQQMLRSKRQQVHQTDCPGAGEGVCRDHRGDAA